MNLTPIIADDRSVSEKLTHNWLVVGTDKGMSGWGKAEGRISYAAWACEGKNLDQVEKWVRARSDMLRVRVCLPGYRPKGAVHLHIYVVDQNHPALR